MLEISVALRMDTEAGRRIATGVRKYASRTAKWRISFVPEPMVGHLARMVRGGKRGLIAALDSDAIVDAAQRLKQPTVNISSRIPGLPFPCVCVDQSASAASAAGHLVWCGFAHFAHYGTTLFPDCDTQCQAFSAALGARGCSCGHRLIRPAKNVQVRLTRWLRGLPKPIGVMAYNDEMARDLVECALRAGMRVPDDVAVVGHGNDLMCCEGGTVSLSSVDVPWESLGQQASEHLAALFEGRRLPDVCIAPVGVISRDSTDTLAVPDEVVAEAVRLIRMHISEPLTVDRLARNLHVTRRTLERHFRVARGHSPHEEIREHRIRRAKELLATTSIPIGMVGAAVGKPPDEHFSNFFKKHAGMTPTDYRTRKRRD